MEENNSYIELSVNGKTKRLDIQFELDLLRLDRIDEDHTVDKLIRRTRHSLSELMDTGVVLYFTFKGELNKSRAKNFHDAINHVWVMCCTEPKMDGELKIIKIRDKEKEYNCDEIFSVIDYLRTEYLWPVPDNINFEEFCFRES